MATEQRDDAARSTLFGDVAESYDANRPGYPDALVTEVLNYAALGDRRAVEVGAGTGRATVPFAARGVPLVCVEPDPRMAEVLRRNTARYPGVRVKVGGFEEWQPGGRRYGLLVAASCWHWLDRARRWDLAHAALASCGTLALFWNQHGVLDEELHAELVKVDARHGIRHSPHSDLASAYADEPGESGQSAGTRGRNPEDQLDL